MDDSRQLGDDAHATPTAMRAVHLYGMLAMASVALAWANNEFVMTEAVFRTLAGDFDQPTQLDAQFEVIERMRALGYAMAPLQTAVRIGLTALLLQGLCLLGGIEMRYGKIFRIAAVAYGAVLFGSTLQIFWIVQQPAGAITRASLGIVPDSLAAWFHATGDTPSILYLGLSRLSLTSVLWMLLVYWGLLDTEQLETRGAAAVTSGAWLTLSTLHVATALFVQQLVR